MPEHVHLLILPSHEDPRVGPILNSIKQSVAKRAVRWMRQHAPDKFDHMADIDPSGQVTFRFWQRGAGQDHNLWSAMAIWKTIDYIHANPVERGLVKRPGDFPWTSYLEHRRAGAGPIVVDRDGLPWRST